MKTQSIKLFEKYKRKEESNHDVSTFAGWIFPVN